MHAWPSSKSDVTRGREDAKNTDKCAENRKFNSNFICMNLYIYNIV